MSKMKIKLKITGFELEVEGSSDEVPKILKDVQNQMSNMIAPPSIMSGKILDTGYEEVDRNEELPKNKSKGKSKSTKRTTTSTNTKNDIQGLLWSNDPNKWGTPQQKWNPTNKMLWTLYVLIQEKQVSQLPLSSIVNIFNSSFKEAGTMMHANASRDIKKAKTNKFVGEDPTKNPSEWYLTQEGKKKAEEIISEAKGNG